MTEPSPMECRVRGATSSSEPEGIGRASSCHAGDSASMHDDNDLANGKATDGRDLSP